MDGWIDLKFSLKNKTKNKTRIKLIYLNVFCTTNKRIYTAVCYNRGSSKLVTIILVKLDVSFGILLSNRCQIKFCFIKRKSKKPAYLFIVDVVHTSISCTVFWPSGVVDILLLLLSGLSV